MTAPEVPQRLEDIQSPGAMVIRELRQIQGTVQGQAEQFLAASVIVGAAIHQRASESPT